jgi:glycosyltransferase involved in cell wall biosynthesis
MRIAQVAPLYESVPPKLYGGTERVVHFLTEELVRLGHEVVLYASGDSQTSAELRATCPAALRLDPGIKDRLAPHVVMIDRVAREAHEFDIVHFHTDYLHFPLVQRGSTPHLTTMHGRLDLPELHPVFASFPDVPLVSISDAQREPIPRAAWLATVHHGLPPSLFRFSPHPDGYLAFIGRFSPEKAPHLAIEIARRVGRKIRIAAKLEGADADYFDSHVRPLLNRPGVEFVGEIDEAGKSEFLGRAAALLFPIEWPEPFGLVMIEALACGTPVIAFRRGSVSEVLTHGETGFLCDNVLDATRAVDRLGRIDRHRCRQVFEERFSAQRMAQDYVRAYEKVLARR